jgi:hypothetical protein
MSVRWKSLTAIGDSSWSINPVHWLSSSPQPPRRRRGVPIIPGVGGAHKPFAVFSCTTCWGFAPDLENMLRKTASHEPKPSLVSSDTVLYCAP